MYRINSTLQNKIEENFIWSYFFFFREKIHWILDTSEKSTLDHTGEEIPP